MNFKNKVVVVTGGGKGLGRSLIFAFARSGARVATCSRSADDLENVKRDAAKEALDIATCVVDIGNAGEVASWAGFLKTKYGFVDILVNNAAILGVRYKITEYPKNSWEEVMRINVNGLFYVTQNILPLMISHKKGFIINVTSSVGRSGRAQWGAYCVSKFALEGFTQVLADEYGNAGIAAISVNPGATRTGMRASAYPEENPMDLPHPDEIARRFLGLLERRDILSFNGRGMDV